MGVLTERAGARAAEEPAWDRGGTQLGKDRWLTKLRKYEQLSYTVLALGIAVASFLAAWRLHGNTSSTYRINSQWGAFTGLFILALAIERALEPFSRKLGPAPTASNDPREKPRPHRRASLALDPHL